MRDLGTPALLEIPGQTGGCLNSWGRCVKRWPSQQRLQEARRGRIGEELLSQTRAGVTEWEVSRTKA